jgi:hypothetical protein
MIGTEGEKMKRAIESTAEVKELKYREILKLRKYCEKIGVEVQLERLYDGYKLCFNNGADFVQHQYSYGSDVGCVEPGGISRKLDYTAVPLEKAKALVRTHKDKLNKKRSENE